MKIFILRHREAFDSGDLTANGQEQSEKIAEYFSAIYNNKGVRLMSSPWERCVKTLSPLAKIKNIRIEMDSSFGGDFELPELRRGWCVYKETFLYKIKKMIDDGGTDVVLCAHREHLHFIYTDLGVSVSLVEGVPECICLSSVER